MAKFFSSAPGQIEIFRRDDGVVQRIALEQRPIVAQQLVHALDLAGRQLDLLDADRPAERLQRGSRRREQRRVDKDDRDLGAFAAVGLSDRADNGASCRRVCPANRVDLTFELAPARRRLDLHPNRAAAAESLDAWLVRKARRGYRVRLSHFLS